MRLQEIESLTSLCATCRKMCRHVCTTHVVTRNEADIPNNRAMVAYKALQRGEFLESEVGNMYEKCAVCGACWASCAIKNDAGEVMLYARADIVDQGLAPKAAVEMNNSVIQEGDPFGLPKAERFAALEKRIASLPDQADVLYFMGCSTAYRQPEIALAVFDLLERARVNFTVIKKKEVCCGKPQYLLGFWDEARKSAQSIAAKIQEIGAKRVIYTCPSCLRVMSKQYSKWDSALPEKIELLHMSQFLKELLNRRKIKLTKKINQVITYHDPCDLGRRLQVFDAPRAVIAAIPGVEFREMTFHHNEALCCGAGGGLNGTNVDINVKASNMVTDFALDSGAQILATACPTCKFSFHRHENKYENLRVLDVVELAAMSLEK